MRAKTKAKARAKTNLSLRLHLHSGLRQSGGALYAHLFYGLTEVRPFWGEGLAPSESLPCWVCAPFEVVPCRVVVLVEVGVSGLIGENKQRQRRNTGVFAALRMTT